jgi:hypothetical protein
MEATVIEFLIGAVVGTISGLLIVKRTGTKTPLKRPLPSVKLGASKSRTLTRQAKTRHVRSRRSRSKPAIVEPILTDAVSDISSSSVGPRTTVLSCPGCGLQAPETLMAEHFVGSPSHEYKTPKVESTKVHAELQEGLASIDLEQDSKDSLRQLLQMLVPPRAFGRRHGQRTVDPLKSLVRTIGPSRNNSSQ